MNINFELYRIFYVVANHKNMTRASEQLYISQPAISQSIKKLETELDGKLFLRSNKGLELTSQGQSFYEHIKGAMELIYNAENDFSKFKGLEMGEVKIGASTTLTKLMLLKPLEEFHKDFKNIKIDVVNDLTSNLILDLKKGKLDLVIFNEGETPEKEVKLTLLKELKPSFVYNNQHFNFEGKTLSLNSLNNYPLILQKTESNTRKHLDAVCLKNKVKLNPTIEVVSGGLVTELADIGLGIGFVAGEPSENKTLAKITLKENLQTVKVYLGVHKSIKPSFATQKFIEYLKY